jgi:hypothetical protein
MDGPSTLGRPCADDRGHTVVGGTDHAADLGLPAGDRRHSAEVPVNRGEPAVLIAVAGAFAPDAMGVGWPVVVVLDVAAATLTTLIIERP